MYAKIFDSIYDGTLVEDWRALITFEQMLILCDSEGFIDMTPYAIARRTGIPIEHIEAGIKFLEQPDPNSRTDVEEGRRIARLDPHRAWGWRIVNHKKYRDMRTADDRREYMRSYMKDYRKNNQENQQKSKHESLPELTVNESKQELSRLANAYTEAEAYTDTDIPVVISIPAEPVVDNANALSASAPTGKSKKQIPFSEIIALYHETLPELPKVAKLTNQRKGYIRQRWLEDLPDLDAWREYFGIVRKSKFLMGQSTGSKGRPPFRADLTWLCRPENIVKVIEGKYHRG